jgi:hypothetical protein
MVAPIVDFVVSLGLDGRIASRGVAGEVLMKEDKLLQEVNEMTDIAAKAEETIDPVEPEQKDSIGGTKLVMAEEIPIGHVSWPALKLYLSSLGGIVFWVSFVGFLFVSELTVSLSTWFMGYWANQYEHHAPWAVPVSLYLSIYSIILICTILTASVSTAVYVFGSIKVRIL